MREHCTWRWIGAIMLVAIALLLVASLPTEALARFFDHPAHPHRAATGDLTRPMRAALALRIAAVTTAIAWLAGAMVLARLRSDQERVAPPAMDARAKLMLAAITAAALLLRLPFMVHGLWFDEIAAIGDFTKYGPGPILGAWFTPSNHVLQSLLTWASAEALGTSEATLRLPSLLAGVGLVPVMHSIGRRAGGEALGLVAAAIVALMPIAVVESAEARGYALMMFFAAVAAWAFLRGWKDGEPWTWMVMALAGALAVWSHFVSVVVVAGLAAVALAGLLGARGDASRRRRALSALVGTAMSALLAATLIAPLAPDILASRSQFRGAPGATPTLLSEEGLRVGLTLAGTWSAAVPPLLGAPPGAALFLLGIVVGLRRRDTRGALAAMLVGVPILLAVVVIGGSWTYARFLSFAAPGAALAIGIGVLWVRRAQPRLGAAAMALLAASYGAELWLLPPRQPFLEAMIDLRSRARPGDAMVDAGIRGVPSAFYAPPEMPVLGSGVMAAQLDARLLDPRVRFVVLSYPRVLPPERMQSLRQRGFELAREWPGWIDWGGGAVQLWERRGVTPPP